MTIPFVIDNQQHTMSEVLNILLAHNTLYLDPSTGEVLKKG